MHHVSTTAPSLWTFTARHLRGEAGYEALDRDTALDVLRSSYRKFNDGTRWESFVRSELTWALNECRGKPTPAGLTPDAIKQIIAAGSGTE